jgi:hypothetical protein
LNLFEHLPAVRGPASCATALSATIEKKMMKYAIVVSNFNRERLFVVAPFERDEGEDNSDSASWMANCLTADQSGEVLELQDSAGY